MHEFFFLKIASDTSKVEPVHSPGMPGSMVAPGLKANPPVAAADIGGASIVDVVPADPGLGPPLKLNENPGATGCAAGPPKPNPSEGAAVAAGVPIPNPPSVGAGGAAA